MISVNFIASNRIDSKDFQDIEKFVDNYPDFQTVTLENENELKLLLELLGIDEYSEYELGNSEFSKYWDISLFNLPELNIAQFDQFFENWISQSQREYNMDEYGSLIFLQGLSSKWNKLRYRLIVKNK